MAAAEVSDAHPPTIAQATRISAFAFRTWAAALLIRARTLALSFAVSSARFDKAHHSAWVGLGRPTLARDFRAVEVAEQIELADRNLVQLAIADHVALDVFRYPSLDQRFDQGQHFR